MEIRKYVTILEEIQSDGGRPMDPPGETCRRCCRHQKPFCRTICGGSHPPHGYWG